MSKVLSYPSEQKRTRALQPPFTPDDDRKIMLLREQRVSPRAIAERMGRSRAAIYVRICKLKKDGKPTYSLVEWTQRRMRAVQLFEAGVTLNELALIYDTSKQNVGLWLTVEGLDGEERELVRKELAALKIDLGFTP